MINKLIALTIHALMNLLHKKGLVKKINPQKRRNESSIIAIVQTPTFAATSNSK